MAQLSDDCFAFGGPLLSIEEAVRLIGERVPVLAGTETVPLAEADNRVAAVDVRAAIDLPPFDNSAVDGYAARFADLAPGDATELPVVGRIAAGAAGDVAGPDGRSAFRIFTGAPMPPGYDTVFMQEDVRLSGETVLLPHGLEPGANRRFAGEDVARGEVAIAAGRRLGPTDLALAAAIGIDRIAVRRPVRVALFSTGDELTEPGEPLGPSAIHDSNRVLIAALLRRLGAEVSDLGIVRDDSEALTARLAAAAAGSDLVLTSGGVSVGEEDHVKAAVERVGRIVAWRLAVKPGRPIAMGLVRGVPFVGLPGNPVAVYVTLLFVVRPLLARLGGAAYRPPLAMPVRVRFGYRKKTGRREFVRASLRRGPDGIVEAVKFPKDGAGLLSSLTGSDGLIELREDLTELGEGETAPFIPHQLLW